MNLRLGFVCLRIYNIWNEQVWLLRVPAMWIHTLADNVKVGLWALKSAKQLREDWEIWDEPSFYELRRFTSFTQALEWSSCFCSLTNTLPSNGIVLQNIVVLEPDLSSTGVDFDLVCCLLIYFCHRCVPSSISNLMTLCADPPPFLVHRGWLDPGIVFSSTHSISKDNLFWICFDWQFVHWSSL